MEQAGPSLVIASTVFSESTLFAFLSAHSGAVSLRVLSRLAPCIS